MKCSVNLTWDEVRYILLPLVLSFFLYGCAAQKEKGHTPQNVSGSSVSAQSLGGSLSIMDTSPDIAPGRTVTVSNATFEDYDEDENSEEIADPLEGWNRFWFAFNDILLLDIIKPVYKGYTYITPEVFRAGLRNFLYNIQMPIRLANSLLQGRFGQAGVEFDRFLVNSTVGLGGLIDVAKRNKPLVEVSDRAADFGQTLATWGVGEGFYLVWPLIGPSTVRDTFGTVGDYAASPFFWAAEPVGPVPFWPVLATNTGLRFNDMGSVINAYEAVTKGAIEPYIAVRDAYVKYRRAGIPTHFSN